MFTLAIVKQIIDIYFPNFRSITLIDESIIWSWSKNFQYLIPNTNILLINIFRCVYTNMNPIEVSFWMLNAFVTFPAEQAYTCIGSQHPQSVTVTGSDTRSPALCHYETQSKTHFTRRYTNWKQTVVSNCHPRPNILMAVSDVTRWKI